VTPASVQISTQYHVFSKHRLASVISLVPLVLGVAACSNNQAADTTPDFPEALAQAEGFKTAAGSNLSGNVKLDGSSTVFPMFLR